MTPSRRQLLAGTGLTLAAVSLSACGTIMYPERKGQIDGKIDTTVAILDGIGLLLFLVPGVIAFAVDFSNGTIYLPGTGRRAEATRVKEVAYTGALTKARLDSVWTETYGYDAPFALSGLQRRPVESPAVLHAELARHAGQQVFAG
ncbi:hypothetical protein [Hyphomonas sp.]|uniref:hypothetical protein n=1 Tax=Hyphomonas sp. TaxID=87 RepID=UPI0025C6A8E5|nr:hypothetical protein [Hyphomonas sp.]